MTRRATAVLIGAILIAQGVGNFLINFRLETPLFGTPGFLAGASPHATQLGFSILLGLVVESLWVVTALQLYPLLRERQPSLARWLVLASGIVVVLAILEQASVMSMVAVSGAYAGGDPAARAALEPVKVIVASARNSVHFMARIFDGVATLTLFLALYRGRLVPRLLAGFGILTSISMMIGVGRTIFALSVLFPMLAPLGLANLLLSIWLFAKGFD